MGKKLKGQYYCFLCKEWKQTGHFMDTKGRRRLACSKCRKLSSELARSKKATNDALDRALEKE